MITRKLWKEFGPKWPHGFARKAFLLLESIHAYFFKKLDIGTIGCESPNKEQVATASTPKLGALTRLENLEVAEGNSIANTSKI
jgi:hypothetical protein